MEQIKGEPTGNNENQEIVSTWEDYTKTKFTKSLYDSHINVKTIKSILTINGLGIVT